MSVSVASQIAVRDFGRKAIASLGKRGIRIISLQSIPDNTSPMPFANATRGYCVDDNGCGRVWTHAEVLEASK